MGTVTAFRARQQVARGDMAKPSASPPRGVIGAALFLLVSALLLVASAAPPAPAGDRAAPHPAGAFVLDPSVPAAES